MIKSCYIHIPFCNTICSYCDFCKLLYNEKIVDSYLEHLEKEIRSINDEINKINERKKLALEEAMETKDKWIATTIKKPHIFSKVTRFFSNKFNTSKVILKTVIEPLKLRISEFKLNELADKGVNV